MKNSKKNATPKTGVQMTSLVCQIACIIIDHATIVNVTLVQNMRYQQLQLAGSRAICLCNCPKKLEKQKENRTTKYKLMGPTKTYGERNGGGGNCGIPSPSGLTPRRRARKPTSSPGIKQDVGVSHSPFKPIDSITSLNTEKLPKRPWSERQSPRSSNKSGIFFNMSFTSPVRTNIWVETARSQKLPQRFSIMPNTLLRRYWWSLNPPKRPNEDK